MTLHYEQFSEMDVVNNGVDKNNISRHYINNCSVDVLSARIDPFSALDVQ